MTVRKLLIEGQGVPERKVTLDAGQLRLELRELIGQNCQPIGNARTWQRSAEAADHIGLR